MSLEEAQEAALEEHNRSRALHEKPLELASDFRRSSGMNKGLISRKKLSSGLVLEI